MSAGGVASVMGVSEPEGDKERGRRLARGGVTPQRCALRRARRAPNPSVCAPPPLCHPRKPLPSQFSIVVFAVIAAFVLFQLYNVLGKKVGRQPEEDAKTLPPAGPAPEAPRPSMQDAGALMAAAGLKARDPHWGIRCLDGEVAPLAQKHGLAIGEIVQMPANNLIVIFRRR